MLERSIRHAWKTNPASRTEQQRNTSSRKRFNDFPPHDASRCEPVNDGICGWFRGDLTQFLHSSRLHLPVYEPMLVDVRRRVRGPRTLGCVKGDYPGVQRSPEPPLTTGSRIAATKRY
jgi:hypothetical protein